MAHPILIVEQDQAFARSMRDALKAKGYEAEETTDAKGCQELIRKKQPALVVMAVDLSAGQNGYIICGKLKKDDDLKTIPVVIIGSPDGFANHKKLKTRADDYVAKPFDAKAIVEKVKSIVGPAAAEAEPEAEESLALDELLDDGGAQDSAAGFEAGNTEETIQGDPELDMVDAMFDEPAAPAEAPAEESVSGLIDGLGPSEELEAAPPPPPPPAPSPKKSAPKSAAAPATTTPDRKVGAADAAELRELRAKVAQLTGSLEDANTRAGEFEAKVQELETDLAAKTAALDSAKSGGGKNEKEVFALRESGSKKDKEILRLKSELNDKEKELIELRDKETSLEQAQSESTEELSKRDAQIKTLTAKTEQLTAEKKKLEQQLQTAKDEARAATAEVGTLQSDLDAATTRAQSAESEVETLRAQVAELEPAKADLEEKTREAQSLQSQLEQTRGQLTAQATSFAKEMSSLRGKISDAEAQASKHEAALRTVKEQVKAEADRRAQLKDQLTSLAESLDAPTQGAEELSLDELAEA